MSICEVYCIVPVINI